MSVPTEADQKWWPPPNHPLLHDTRKCLDHDIERCVHCQKQVEDLVGCATVLRCMRVSPCLLLAVIHPAAEAVAAQIREAFAGIQLCFTTR